MSGMDRDALIKQLANIPEKKLTSKPVGTEELVGRLKEGGIFGKTRKEMAAYGISDDEFNEMAIRVSLGEDPKELFAELVAKKKFVRR
ncbi:MAG: hypothetical protein IJK13_05295 [Lachnospiraceae bacterium]|jgi:hypothetical protein|nr:hypothetical protein [Lachnospiraceae bacterium]MBQ9342084.1 hypothetical protein [Lachnospiraceae bacterium]MBR0435403.1 hypothetical protein [Lachnospiraceae bacterium]